MYNHKYGSLILYIPMIFVFLFAFYHVWNTHYSNVIMSAMVCFKLCASFHSHHWIQTGVSIRNPPIWVKSDDCFSRVSLMFDGWPWKKNNRAPFLSNIKLNICLVKYADGFVVVCFTVSSFYLAHMMSICPSSSWPCRPLPVKKLHYNNWDVY